MKNSVFIHNQTTSTAGSDNGGAVNVESGYGDFTNCKFVGNTSSKQGGAVFLAGSTYKATNGIFNFTNCLFENNKAENGGAIAQVGADYRYLSIIVSSTRTQPLNGLVVVPFS